MSRLYKKPLYRPVPIGVTILEANDGTKYAVWMAGGREKIGGQGVVKGEIVSSAGRIR